MNKNDVLEMLEAHLAKIYPSNEKINSVCFATENLLDGRIGLPITVRFTRTTKEGKTSLKKRETMFYPPYDPFTGDKLPQKEISGG